MKILDQIYRYTSDCRFPEDDWSKVLDFCRNLFGGGNIHKSMRPKSDSTYEQFLNWIECGFGSGDMICYGNTMGIISSSTPDNTTLAAYCDFDGNLIVKEMKVLDVDRLKLLDSDRCSELNKLMYQDGFEYDVRLGKAIELYIPQKYFYVTLNNNSNKYNDVGMYLESDGCNHHFLAYLTGNELKMDCWINADYTPFKKAKDSDIKRLHSAASHAGWSFNERTKQFIKLKKKNRNNHYWYMNDRFEILSDIDNGAKKHTDRYNIGNYFVDQTEALLFLREVMDLVEKKRV